MEPTTLIISALVAGATAALKETASQAVKDAYAGLKALVQKHFAASQMLKWLWPSTKRSLTCGKRPSRTH
jgi:hypothetical protein